MKGIKGKQNVSGTPISHMFYSKVNPHGFGVKKK